MPKKQIAIKPGKQTFGAGLIESLDEVRRHVRGEITLERIRPAPIDVAAIRKSVRMTQEKFASCYGINKRALQEWEQGRAEPDTGVLAYLNLIQKRPAIVEEILG